MGSSGKSPRTIWCVGWVVWAPILGFFYIFWDFFQKNDYDFCAFVTTFRQFCLAISWGKDTLGGSCVKFGLYRLSHTKYRTFEGRDFILKCKAKRQNVYFSRYYSSLMFCRLRIVSKTGKTKFRERGTKIYKNMAFGILQPLKNFLLFYFCLLLNCCPVSPSPLRFFNKKWILSILTESVGRKENRLKILSGEISFESNTDKCTFSTIYLVINDIFKGRCYKFFA